MPILVGLFASSHMSYEPDRDRSDDGQPSLSEMTVAAVEHLLEGDNGFFLMVESGRIDHAHHDTNAKRAMEETLEFEKTVAVRFYIHHTVCIQTVGYCPNEMLPRPLLTLLTSRRPLSL